MESLEPAGGPLAPHDREELLAWYNEQFETNASCFGDLSDGVVLLQMLDALFPGSVELARLNLAPTSVDERLRNLEAFKAGLPIDIGGAADDVLLLARGDEDALAQLAQALRVYAEGTAERIDALEGYVASRARMEARAAGAPVWGEGTEGRVSPVDSPKVTQRQDELQQLVDCLKQELTKRMQALEDQQSDFYEARHERGLLFSALQRVERICMQMIERDPAHPLAGELLGIIAETPDDWRPCEVEDGDFVDAPHADAYADGLMPSAA